MSNVYNVISRPPAIEAKDMPQGLEELAQDLVKSGRLRIDAHEKINFIRYPNGHQVTFFSHRELHDPKLVPDTIRQIGQKDLEIMRREISTNQPVGSELEIRLARIFVQCNHPAVIKLIILTGVEVFLSFSYNIGDLLDLESWQQHGSNSGMQSIGAETRVYVSSDGDPFDTNPENIENTKYSLARFMIIAAQETGHFADLKRDSHARPIGRFSLHGYRYEASEKVGLARKKDMAQLDKTRDIFAKLHLGKAAKIEKSISFFEKHRRYSLKHISTIFKAYVFNNILRQRALKYNLKVAELHGAKDLSIMLADMAFNLSPQAEVYKNKNKVIEEAIACVEALARVPQQVVKWGNLTTRYIYPNLHRIYYAEVIPANIKAVERITGKKFRINMSKKKKRNF